MTQSMMHRRNIRPHYWVLHILNTVYVINRTQQPQLAYTFAYDRLTRRLKVSHLKVICCVGNAMVPKLQQTRIYVSRDDVIDEASTWSSAKDVAMSDSTCLAGKIEKLKMVALLLDVADGAADGVVGEV
ncbi:hypothetical protein AMTR_s00003p00050760 [Amborella trichopoda]|uniref:Uncharacterized protein n=1 Tax=Amborella trichopoda TaxID=13333 RepID=W1P600_AMBTC|nr:hypothetical protein AMTR_s00003p00050760 [Amborella trichopoda]